MKTKLLTLIGLAAMLGTAFSNEPYPNLVFSPDGHYDIGSPTTNRPGNLYLAGSVFASGPTGASYATTATAAGTTTLTNTSKAMQYFTGSTTQTVVLPVASTMTVGQAFTLENLSSGLVTVQSSGSNVVGILAPNTRSTIRCLVASGTNAASWDWFYEGDNSASGKVETFNNSLTFAGTDGTTFTFPSVSDTVTTVTTNPVLHAVAVPLSAAQINGMYATPVQLVAAAGSGKTIVVAKVGLRLARTATAFASGGVGIIQYGNTANGAGTNAVDSTIASTYFTGASGTSETVRQGAVLTDQGTALQNTGIFISNQTGAFTTGTGTATVDVWYYVF